MNFTRDLIVNAILSAVIVSIIGMIISTSLMYLEPNFTLASFTFWPRVLLAYFITGFISYLIFH